MCEKCYDFTKEYALSKGYNLTDDDIYNVLMNGTAFPFGEFDYIKPQIIKFIDGEPNKENQTFDDVCRYSYDRILEELDAAMEQYRKGLDNDKG